MKKGVDAFHRNTIRPSLSHLFQMFLRPHHLKGDIKTSNHKVKYLGHKANYYMKWSFFVFMDNTNRSQNHFSVINLQFTAKLFEYACRNRFYRMLRRSQSFCKSICLWLVTRSRG